MTSRLLVSAAALLVVTACADAPIGPDLGRTSAVADAKGANGGGGTTTPAPQVLPTTAPAAGILYRESFGPAEGLRPAGGKGDLRTTALHTTIGGYWVEWPGTKDNRWITPDGDQTWKFAGCSPDTPGELPSPLQVTYGNGCASSEWFDAVTQYPAALLPFTAPATAYEVTLATWPSPVAGAYVGLGFTNSGATLSNLATVGVIWIRMRDLRTPGGLLDYELRVNGMSGPVLARGELGVSAWDRIGLRYDPAAQTITLRVDDTIIGTYPFAMAAPRYVGFEGVGVVDDFVIRQ